MQPGKSGSDSGRADAPTTPAEATPDTSTTVMSADWREGLDPLIGLQIENYHILSSISAGGFGQVYLARDTKLDRKVAVKFLKPEQRLHRDLFEREAKAIAALKHRSIVQIYTWGEYAAAGTAETMVYFVLELLEASAQDLLERSPGGLPAAAVLRIGAECAEGLSYAHHKGILHRDIKPGNILIDGESGNAKIVDFGLAHFAGASHATITGTISGSPPYMSPEQANGERLDARSDVFSLGSTLYALLSGRAPFHGSQDEVLEKVRDNDRPPLKDFCPDLPIYVLDIVEKAMETEPARRYQKASEFGADLRLASKSLESPGENTALPAISIYRKRGGFRHVRRVGLAGIAALFIFGVYLVFGSTNGGNLSQPVLALAREQHESHNLPEAEKLYLDYLEAHPSDQDALYGLAYALLQQLKGEAAAARFEQLAAAPLRSEGKAAVAYESNTPDSRAEVESSAAAAQTPYATTLLASLHVAEQDYAAATELLNRIDAKKFGFEWQRVQYLRTLGQALYHAGEFAEAAAAFQELQAVKGHEADSVAAGYLSLLAEKTNAERRARVSEQVARVRQLLDQQESPQPQPQDEWTSRPLRFCVLPVSSRTRLASDSGLADLMPSLLGRHLQRVSGMDMVDRALIEEVLAEQELSGRLSTNEGRLLLGQILGARLLIECSFHELFSEDSVGVKVVNTETTQDSSPEPLNVSKDVDVDAWLADVAGRTWEAIAARYPIRGSIEKKPEGWTADIGAGVGVKAGTVFAVCAQPDAGSRIAGLTAVVQEPVGADGASIRVEGTGAEELTGKLYIVQQGEKVAQS